MTRTRVRIVARWGGVRSGYSSFFAVSAAVHALFLFGLILAPSLFGRPEIPEDFITVQLAPGLPGTTPAAARPTPPQPPPSKPVEPEEGVRAEPREPEPEPAPKVKPKESKPEPEKPVPAAESPPPPLRSGGGDPDMEPPPEESGGSGGAGTITPMSGGDEAFAWYRASVTAALHGNWRRPILSGIRETLEVTVALEIQRDGRVTNLRIEQSSGVPSLDRSALRAVADAAPLPPLPNSWREPSLPAGFVFRQHPEDP
jgi:protein TonB